ncbi:MAG: D-aminoacyl-tRNA deacylase [Erysipelotrichaceae bacterium]
MKILVQRVKNASVTIENKLFSQINCGYLLLVGFSHRDDERIVELMAQKVLNLRICDDLAGKMNLSIIDTKGEILSVSQFTLYGDAAKGRRPSFVDACNPQRAVELYDYFNAELRKSGLKVETGQFRAEMDVQLVNSGPITIMLDSDIIIKG